MRSRAPARTATICLALAALCVPAAAKSTAHPKTGVYRGHASNGVSIRFRVVHRTCPPAVRGGLQNQRLGYCYVPGPSPAVTETCPSGFVRHDIYLGLFQTLLSSKGKLTLPVTSSDGGTGTFHIAVDNHGHATGYYEQVIVHGTDSGALEKCPTGRITFTASVA